MDTTTLSIQLDAQNLAAVDAMARAQGVDRETILSTAIVQHIAHYQWSCRHIQQALDEPDLASEEEVAAEFARWKDPR
ncbi:MAG: hypothetical protein H7Y22_06800 [Gemmatimonadaceae bacterium]|nr:hypothetical protein [Gloeobacterales cyanobacterium ES-bin-141]